MKITRRQLRNTPLLEICKTCPTDSWEPEEGLTICQCFGRYDASNDEPLQECKNCMAWNLYKDWETVWERIREIKEGAK